MSVPEPIVPCYVEQQCGLPDVLIAAAVQARAICIQAALVTRRENSTPETVTATADKYWHWVSQPIALRETSNGPLTGRKRPR